jgi:hypothetical protein
MGARMQKDLAKLTAILAGILSICLFIMGFLTISMQQQSAAGDVPPIAPTEKVEEPLLPSGSEAPDSEAPALEDDSKSATEEEAAEPVEPESAESDVEEAGPTEAEVEEAEAEPDTEESGGEAGEAEEKSSGADASGS